MKASRNEMNISPTSSQSEALIHILKLVNIRWYDRTIESL